MIVPLTPMSLDKPSPEGADKESAGDNIRSKAQLQATYPFAFSDFYGRGTPCVYKSGPEWPTQGARGESLVREPRPVHDHAIQPTWVPIGTRICDELESHGIEWEFVNPFAYANAGDAKPFCPLIICVGVSPGSLAYKDAVAGAALVKDILTGAGFPDIEVAFIESIMTRATGAKLPSFNPLLQDIPSPRKPFTPTLGLSIASYKRSHLEGTGTLYFRLPGDDRRVALMTCAHVARPPPHHSNPTITRKDTSRAAEKIIMLGTWGYNNAINDMMSTIGGHIVNIDIWHDTLDRLGKINEGDDGTKVAAERKEYSSLVEKAMKEIQTVKALRDELVENFTTLEQRIIGFVLHSEKIEVSVEPYQFTNDWALIELYQDKFDWKTFRGNKIWLGGQLSAVDYCTMMYPVLEDQKAYGYPKNGLLQANDFVRADEIRKPQHIDVHGEKCLLVVKNGMATGTTIGRVNGLESFTRVYKEYNISQKSLEIAVLPYDKTHRKFSEAGDSGSVVLDREGRIVGILTGGSGPADETDTSYLTPYWWIDEQVKTKFPGCHLYEVVP